MRETYKDILLKLARKSIEIALDQGTPCPPADTVVSAADISSLPDGLDEKRGTFVTLTINGDLRGCIGHIEPVQPLYIDVIENACSAAFRDPRFPPLNIDEVSDIIIEISLLTVPEELEYKDADDLLMRLEPGRHGVILSKGYRSSTFLPQVWGQLPDKKKFLSHLCMKAGLPPDAWKNEFPQIKVYEAEHFSE
ncbi:MAG: AmmeMemoRadiSam system protein A [Candidatus Woesearchaeota archaeon]